MEILMGKATRIKVGSIITRTETGTANLFREERSSRNFNCGAKAMESLNDST